jgi:hypothetical protein
MARQTIHDIDERLVAEGMPGSLAEAFEPSLERDTTLGREIHVLDAAKQHLNAFARAASRPLRPVPPRARAEMERILQDPIFDVEARKPNALERLAARLREILFDLFSSFLETASSHATLIIVIVGAIIAAALLVFVRKLGRILRAGARPVSLSRTHIGAGHVAERVDPLALIAQARASAAEGRERAAMKLLSMASVIALRERGEIPADPGLTDLEAVRWLADRGRVEIHTPFERLSTLHDGIVFGGREAATGALEDALRLAHLLVEDSGRAENVVSGAA